MQQWEIVNLYQLFGGGVGIDNDKSYFRGARK